MNWTATGQDELEVYDRNSRAMTQDDLKVKHTKPTAMNEDEHEVDDRHSKAMS